MYRVLRLETIASQKRGADGQAGVTRARRRAGTDAEAGPLRLLAIWLKCSLALYAKGEVVIYRFFLTSSCFSANILKKKLCTF